MTTTGKLANHTIDDGICMQKENTGNALKMPKIYLQMKTRSVPVKVSEKVIIKDGRHSKS
jgi:hypothetical protein